MRHAIPLALVPLLALPVATACKRSAVPLPPECEAELALMTCVAEHLRPGPTRPDVRSIRADLERELAAKGAAALAARCRLDTDSLKLTSGAMCEDGG